MKSPRVVAFNRAALPVVVGGLIGGLAWGGGLATLMLAPLVVAAWAAQGTRGRAWLVMLAYYLAAARGLPVGAANFYGADTPAAFSVALWLVASLALSAPWAVVWARDGLRWRIPLALVLTAVPPLGLLGWANPITAAGVFFPSLGWFGLVAMIVAMIGLSRWPVRASGCLALAALIGILTAAPTAPDWIESEQTAYGGAGGAGRDFMKDYAANLNMISLAQRKTAKVMLFPETVAGMWTPAAATLWEETAKQLRSELRTVLIGAEIPIQNSRKTRNGLVILGLESGAITQRIPMPVSMWKPWTDIGTEANIFGDGITTVNGNRAALFVCYEQVLVWPMLLSQAESPDIMLGAANAYWAAQTSIPGIQTTSMLAWSRLFRVPYVSAINR